VPAPPTRRQPHKVCCQNLPALGHRAKSCRFNYGGAETIARLPRDVPETDADPDRESWCRCAPILAINRLLDTDGSGQCVGRTRERGHDSIANALEQRSVVRCHRVSEETVMGTP